MSFLGLSLFICFLLLIFDIPPVSLRQPDVRLPSNMTLLPQICSACVRCKSCGATPGKNWDVEWSGDYSLCPRCTELYEKGGTWQENRTWGGCGGMGQALD